MPISLAGGRVPSVRVAGLAVVLIALVVLCAAPRAQAAHRSVHASARNDRVEAAVVALLNQIRTSKGLPLLHRSRSLNHASDAHSRGMVASGLFSHDSPSGASADVRIRHFVDARIVGETISWLVGTPAGQQARRTVDLWMNSPPHRATLLDGSFHRIGVGRRRGTLQGHRGVAFTADLAS